MSKIHKITDRYVSERFVRTVLKQRPNNKPKPQWAMDWIGRGSGGWIEIKIRLEVD